MPTPSSTYTPERPETDAPGKATTIRLFDVRSAPMRAFHVTWVAFFLCFFAWFGVAPLMTVVRAEFGMTDLQVKNTIIASVAITILSRLFIGWLCDRVGPRIAYTYLLVIGSLPVMGIGLSQSYESFLVFRLLIGLIGGSFVVTQFHTSLMFAPKIVGTANATTAGWGNLGGGVTQFVMPLVFAGFMALGFGEFWSWRLSMVCAGVVCLLAGVAYYYLTVDTPAGNFRELRAAGELPPVASTRGGFSAACKDGRVWALFVIYGACFGIELTINNIAALYFSDRFQLGLTAAGIVASLFGLVNIFARTLGGYLSDKLALRFGLGARVRWLFFVVLCEGLFLMLFARMNLLMPAIVSLVAFSLFVQMSTGATYAVVPFVNKKALGAVSGIVGAGGNAGALGAGLLLRYFTDWGSALFTLGSIVTVSAFAALAVRLSSAADAEPAAASEGAESRRLPRFAS